MRTLPINNLGVDTACISAALQRTIVYLAHGQNIQTTSMVLTCRHRPGGGGGKKAKRKQRKAGALAGMN
jgi:hypothetical protein